jgi:Ala-tRNA(Pro) deacylase
VAIANTLRLYLEDRGVGYDLVAHPHAGSSRELASLAHLPADHLAKGVVLRDAQGFVLLVIPATHWARLHAVRQALNRPLELAEEREIERLFADCAPGAIPAAGQAYELETLLDEALTSLAEVYFEAGDHEQLVRVTGEAFLHLMRGARRGHFSHEG